MSNLIYIDGELYHAEDFSTEELLHYGVPGMKWGKRRGGTDRAAKKAAKKTAKESARYEKSLNRMAKTAPSAFVWNYSAGIVNKQLPSLNAKYKNANVNGDPKTWSKETKAYVKEYQTLNAKAEQAAMTELKRRRGE